MSLQEDALLPSSDSFWEVDCYKRTVKRTEDGLQMCNELMKFIQDRAEIEKEYAKRLKAWSKKWSESFDKSSEYGTCKATLKGVLDESERLANLHLTIKDGLLNEVQTEIKDWRNENYKKQLVVGGCKEAKNFEDDFKKAQKPWSKRLVKVLKCKKDYHMSCKLEKTAINQENNARNSSEVSPDQLKKFQEKVEKCRKDVESTREKYQQSLSELNAYNARYVEDMTEVYNKTQEFEEKRLRFFKKVLCDIHTHLDLTQYDGIPDIYARLKKTIDMLDPSRDLKWWSENNGVDMPMAWPAFDEYSPEFGDFSHKKSGDAAASGSGVTLKKITTSKHFEEFGEYVTEFHSISSKDRGKNVVMGGDGVMLTAVQKNESIPSVAVQSAPSVSNQSASFSERQSNYAKPLTLQTNNVPVQNPFGEDDWDDSDNVSQDDSSEGVKVKALFNYDGQESDELSFKAGETFLKIKDKDDQGWCTGKKDGRIGLYPDSYVLVVGK